MGGIETFVLNFVDMLSEYYDIVVMSPKVPDLQERSGSQNPSR